MIRLVDIVNFNADASAFSSRNWLNVLEGGKESDLYRFLQLYIDAGRKVTLGFVGSSAAEIAMVNPESVELINEHPDIFEIVLRPFSHDLALLWDDPVFKTNVRWGKSILEKLFDKVNTFFLPPEFVLKNSQIQRLEELGVTGVFTHLDRMKRDHRERVPKGPYVMSGLFGTEMKCIPFQRKFTHAYLKDIQTYEHNEFDQLLDSAENGTYFFWRDGESSFLIPETLDREAHYLRYNRDDVDFISFSEALNSVDFKTPHTDEYPYYPANTLVPWLKDFRFYWFLTDLKSLEGHFNEYSLLKKVLFLSLINSDILSSIEKDAVNIELRMNGNYDFVPYTIIRKPKNIEGAEFIEMLHWTDRQIEQLIQSSDQPHHKKLWIRYNFFVRNEIR